MYARSVQHGKLNMEAMSTQREIVIRSYSLKELSGLYGVNPRTLRKWLTPIVHLIGEKIGRYYTVKQVTMIFSHLGVPKALVSIVIDGIHYQPRPSL